MKKITKEQALQLMSDHIEIAKGMMLLYDEKEGYQVWVMCQEGILNITDIIKN